MFVSPPHMMYNQDQTPVREGLGPHQIVTEPFLISWGHEVYIEHYINSHQVL